MSGSAARSARSASAAAHVRALGEDYDPDWHSVSICWATTQTLYCTLYLRSLHAHAVYSASCQTDIEIGLCKAGAIAFVGRLLPCDS